MAKSRTVIAMSHNVIGCPVAGDDCDKVASFQCEISFIADRGLTLGVLLGVDFLEQLRDELIGLCENWNIDGGKRLMIHAPTIGAKLSREQWMIVLSLGSWVCASPRPDERRRQDRANPN